MPKSQKLSDNDNGAEDVIDNNESVVNTFPGLHISGLHTEGPTGFALLFSKPSKDNMLSLNEYLSQQIDLYTTKACTVSVKITDNGRAKPNVIINFAGKAERDVINLLPNYPGYEDQETGDFQGYTTWKDYINMYFKEEITNLCKSKQVFVEFS